MIGSGRRIRDALDAGRVPYGVTVQLPSPEIVEIAGAVGLDWVWIDAEHGSLGLEDIRHLIRAADAVGVDTIVRVPDGTPSYIQRVLDLGARGILVPHLRTPQDAIDLVRAGRYGPTGERGACPFVRSTAHYSLDWTADADRANADVLLLGLIEDPEGVENVEAIAAVPGLDGLSFGPIDLAVTLGLGSDPLHPILLDMYARVHRACRDAGIYYLGSGVLDKHFEDRAEADIVSISTDRRAVFEVWQGDLAHVRGIERSLQPGGVS